MAVAETHSNAFKPRNLVVLSDGTGNSAAKLFKTNVWRFYDALDLSCPDQVALYDDGVGSAAFKPLAILGGVFGFGLKRNVLDLYTFLCRNYRFDPDTGAHDRIFAFGFSRGAFTARVVAALVAHEGLVQTTKESDLRRLSAWAYRRYRAGRYRHSLGVRLLRSVRDRVLRVVERIRGQADYRDARRLPVNIDFLGVWDTVAAYGLPTEELARGWDRWVWPMLPKDRELSPRVLRACHALALDDERQTFFPLLWNETKEPQNATSTTIGSERISQVWFAGMHSNVGGGYPDDSLAYTPLRWMATQAAASGLRFAPTLCPGGHGIPDAWIERAVACAPMNDSRKGAGAYYRYHPRPVERLCTDPDAGVTVDRPKIHESVFGRLRDTLDGYATIVLPERYAIVTANGRILDGDSGANPAPAHPNPFEHTSQSKSRRALQEHVQNAVWCRRVLYFMTLAMTLSVLLLPFWPGPDPLGFVAGPHHWLSALVGTLASFVPGFAEPWLHYYEQNPLQLVTGLAFIAVLLWSSKQVEDEVFERMRTIWRGEGFVAKPVRPASPLKGFGKALRALRTSGAYRGTFRFFSQHVWPNVFGVAVLLVLFLVMPIRLGFEVSSRAGQLPSSTCAPGDAATRNTDGTVPFWPHLMCNATGTNVVRGETYRIDIARPGACSATDGLNPEERRNGPWADKTYPVGNAPGFSTATALSEGWRGLPFLIAQPLRRVLHADWYAVVAAIGTYLPERHVIAPGSETFVAGRSGPLTLFVNDAIVPCPGWDCFYKNNAGGAARVRITQGAAPGDRRMEALAPYNCDEQTALFEQLTPDRAELAKAGK
jgi:uncharacterized protein (DUF2235 family)